jgi:archaellum component FlaC
MNNSTTTAESTATDQTATTDELSLETVYDQLEALTNCVEELKDQLERKDERIDELESTVDCQDSLLEALRRKAGGTREMVTELQARELEKHAHLRWDNVEPNVEILEVETDRVEKFTKDDGDTYARIPGGEDPLNRGGQPALTPGDLLPIQQLARMDDDMLHSAASSKPVRLAAQLWRDRHHDRSTLWKQGCNGVREYVDAGELAQWLHHNEPGVNKEYSQKLAGRTIDALLDLTKRRLYVKRKTRRKDGLSYKERRVILPEDLEIPGETSSETITPETAAVGGE